MTYKPDSVAITSPQKLLDIPQDLDRLAAKCEQATEILDGLIGSFGAIEWHQHAMFIQSLASHLPIYAHQLRAKAAKEAA